MDLNDKVTLNYRFVNGETIEISVSREIAGVFASSKRIENKIAMQHFRHGSNAELQKVLEVRNAAFLSQTAESIEDIVLNNELSKTLYSAMDLLTATQKRRLLLRFSMDYTLDEISRIEKVSIQSVSESIQSALKHLKNLIEKELSE